MVEKIRLFFSESRQEFYRINWPTANETIKLTLVVISMSVGVAVFLGLFDALFTYLLSTYLVR